jgi:hypothetical protein
MKAMIALVSFALLAGGAIAAEKEKKAPSPAQLAQQEKMKSCNAEAKTKELKGEERKKFMSGCLSSKPAAAKKQDNKGVQSVSTAKNAQK